MHIYIAKHSFEHFSFYSRQYLFLLTELIFCRHLARRQQHYKARQQDRQSQNRPQSAYSFKTVSSSSNLTSLNGPPFGGSFLRLEQDWRETHMSYLQHRNAANSVAQNTLTIGGSRMPRPASATSLRSARHSRINRH